MDDGAFRRVVRVALAAEQLGCFSPTEWVGLGTALLALGREDAEILDLAILSKPVSAWSTDGALTSLRERLSIEATDSNDAVELMARALADDLRARPASVTAPMVRMLARLAPPDYSSALANECYGVEEYLDCNCVAEVDPSLEADLEARPSLDLPDGVVQILTRRLRATLPAEQPPRSH